MDAGRLYPSVAYRDAASARQPIHRWEPKRRGQTESGLATMAQLAAELLPHIDTSGFLATELATTGMRQ